MLKPSSVIGRSDDDDEDEDPYTTTDPKKREPSPCESRIACIHGHANWTTTHSASH